jgi:MFS family permease
LQAYDIFTVGLLTVMLGIVFYPGVGTMPTSSDTAIKLATSAGTIVGQLGFGALADVVGRKRMYGLELIVIIFATFGQAVSSSSPSIDVIGLIIFWRVLMVRQSWNRYSYEMLTRQGRGHRRRLPPELRHVSGSRDQGVFTN